MANKGFIEDSELRIAICDDDKSDREKVHVLLQDYLKICSQYDNHIQLTLYLILLLEVISKQVVA